MEASSAPWKAGAPLRDDAIPQIRTDNGIGAAGAGDVEPSKTDTRLLRGCDVAVSAGTGLDPLECRLFSSLQLVDALDGLTGNAASANDRGTEPPNELAVANARTVILCAASLGMDVRRPRASAEAGVGIPIFGRKQHAVVECGNDGEIGAVTKDCQVVEFSTDAGALRSELQRLKALIDG